MRSQNTSTASASFASRHGRQHLVADQRDVVVGTPAYSGGSACAPRNVVRTRTPVSDPSARATRSIFISVSVSRP